MTASARQIDLRPRRWRRFVACPTALACAVMSIGCGGPRRTDTPAIKAAGEQTRNMREQCEERRRSGEFKSVTEVERCADPLVTSAYQEAGYPYMDLIRFAAAARLAGAEKVDKGEITESGYERQRLMLRDRLAAEINRRNAESTPPPPAQTLDPSTTARLVDGLSAFTALRQ